IAVHNADGFQSFIHAAKARHHSVANCLDDRAVMATNSLCQHGKMIPHQRVSGSVANPAIHCCRAAQISEQDHLGSNCDLLVWRDNLTREEITKLLPIRYSGGG